MRSGRVTTGRKHSWLGWSVPNRGDSITLSYRKIYSWSTLVTWFNTPSSRTTYQYQQEVSSPRGPAPSGFDLRRSPLGYNFDFASVIGTHSMPVQVALTLRQRPELSPFVSNQHFHVPINHSFANLVIMQIELFDARNNPRRACEEPRHSISTKNAWRAAYVLHDHCGNFTLIRNH